MVGQTYETYLTLESQSEERYEFQDGLITNMAGGTLAHGHIQSNVNRSLGNAIVQNDKDCIVYSSDVKIHINATNSTFYPDASVVCGSPEVSEKDRNALVNPILIVEVLSDSTAIFDLSVKFGHYRELASLKEYIVVSQKSARIDTYFRTTDQTWDIRSTEGWDQTLSLQSIGAQIALADAFRKVAGIDPTLAE